MDLPITDPILQLTLLLALALLVQLSLERVHIPGITGLLLVGILLGPGGAGALPQEPVAELLGGVGLVFIMFLAGLEIDLDVAAAHRREVLTFGVAAFLLSLAPALLAGRLLGLDWAGAFLVGAALASHALLAFPLIERMGIAGRPAIVSAVGGTLLTDTAALTLLVVTLSVAGGGAEEGFDPAGLLPLAWLAILAAVSLRLLPPLARAFFNRVDDRPAKALFVLVTLLALATVADLIETEDILGAFLAGVCLNRAVRERPELHEHIAFVGRMLFIPFFFISTGMLLELEVLAGGAGVWVAAGGLLLVVLAGKTSATLLSGWRFGYQRAEMGTMVGLTLPQAPATLAVMVTARQAGFFGEELGDAIILVIFLTCLAGPLLARWSGSRLAAAEGEPDRGLEGEGRARREAP